MTYLLFILPLSVVVAFCSFLCLPMGLWYHFKPNHSTIGFGCPRYQVSCELELGVARREHHLGEVKPTIGELLQRECVMNLPGLGWQEQEQKQGQKLCEPHFWDYYQPFIDKIHCNEAGCIYHPLFL
jgi:hypothetical protein